MASSYASHQPQKKAKGGNEPWRSNDRHYCALCNAWMGSDRQSILLHENGKKHREAVEQDLKRRRDDKAKKEKEKKDLESVFAKVNAAAGVSAGGVCEPAVSNNFGTAKPWEYLARQNNQVTQAAQAVKPPASKIKKNHSPTQQQQQKPKQERAVAFDPNVGHYELEGTTYLEGQVYAKILEEGMPIQLWMGSIAASDEEKRDLRNYNHWKKMALLAKVTKKKKRTGGGAIDDAKDDDNTISCHVSYLQNATDEDETLESNVIPSRIRLVLGSDPSIPSTLEGAHLALMGGEQTIDVSNNNKSDDAPEIDDNTGLSGWSTTTIRKVSSHYEQNQERKRKRQHEKEVSEYKEKKEREIQARKMEEAKYANAHDSALGAYDVWSSANSAAAGGEATRAYKGVDIIKETKVEVSDTAKSLSKGMGNVAFKKKKKFKKKNNVRKTFADDD